MDFQFCPKCGQSLTIRSESEGEKLPVCKSCGFVFYQNSKPTTSAVIEDGEGKVLLLKRSEDPGKGKWDILGGFLKNGEDPIIGLFRECDEEIGAKPDVRGLLGIYVSKYIYDRIEYNTFNVFYIARLNDKNIKLSEENSDYKWFSEDEIPWGKMAFEHNDRVLKDYFKKIAKGS